MTPDAKTTPSSCCAKEKEAEKGRRIDKDAGSREDWEGGGSRPAAETVPPVAVSQNSPTKNLQKQADSVAKTNHGDDGPPKNLQSLPTQDTKEIKPEPDEV